MKEILCQTYLALATCARRERGQPPAWPTPCCLRSRPAARRSVCTRRLSRGCVCACCVEVAAVHAAGEEVRARCCRARPRAVLSGRGVTGAGVGCGAPHARRWLGAARARRRGARRACCSLGEAHGEESGRRRRELALGDGAAPRGALLSGRSRGTRPVFRAPRAPASRFPLAQQAVLWTKKERERRAGAPALARSARSRAPRDTSSLPWGPAVVQAAPRTRCARLKAPCKRA